MARRILIVEHDPKAARDLFLLFHRPGGSSTVRHHEPEIAECVAEALEKISSERFHCVLLGAELPEMQIDEAIALVRTARHDIPIVVMADKNTLEREARVRRQSVYYYHLKSFDPNDLRLAVRSIDRAARRARRFPRPSGGVWEPICLKRLGSRPNAANDARQARKEVMEETVAARRTGDGRRSSSGRLQNRHDRADRPSPCEMQDTYRE